MATRSQVIAAARSWLGTPFRHQGREKGAWVDCIGLVIGVAKETSLVGMEWDILGYGALPVPSAMERGLDDHMDRVPRGEQLPGDVPWMSDPDLGGQPRHVGILTDRGTLIHAHSNAANRARQSPGRVVEQRLDEQINRRVRRYYRFRGIEEN